MAPFEGDGRVWVEGFSLIVVDIWNRFSGKLEEEFVTIKAKNWLNPQGCPSREKKKPLSQVAP